MVILESSGVAPPENATLENNSGSAEFLRALVNIPRPVFGFWPSPAARAGAPIYYSWFIKSFSGKKDELLRRDQAEPMKTLFQASESCTLKGQTQISERIRDELKDVLASPRVSMLPLIGAAGSGFTAHRQESLLVEIVSVFVDSGGPPFEANTSLAG